jgi:hypothetical protein
LAAEGTVAFCGSLAIVVGWGFSVWDFFVAQWWWMIVVADLGEGVWMAFVAWWGWWFCPSRQEWRRWHRHVTTLVVDSAKSDLVDLQRHGFAQISDPKANEMRQKKKIKKIEKNNNK